MSGAKQVQVNPPINALKQELVAEVDVHIINFKTYQLIYNAFVIRRVHNIVRVA
ncbi:hypothetical protein O9992_00755 [Vibrio lentus]|nr:hypothetical protein [Vibrio lentus]